MDGEQTDKRAKVSMSSVSRHRPSFAMGARPDGIRDERELRELYAIVIIISIIEGDFHLKWVMLMDRDYIWWGLALFMRIVELLVNKVQGKNIHKQTLCSWY